MKTKIIKVCIFFLHCALFFASASIVFADGIYAPADNAFFDEHCFHGGDCVFLKEAGRRYIATSGNESEIDRLYLYGTPNDDGLGKPCTALYQNGSILHIYWTYTDEYGKEWGLVWDSIYVTVDGIAKKYSYSGWFRMSDVTLIYDAISFMEDHGEELTPYEDGLLDLSKKEDFIAWNFPGDISGTYWKVSSVDISFDDPQCVYLDKYGGKWARFTFSHGRYDNWIYTPDPYRKMAIPLN